MNIYIHKEIFYLSIEFLIKSGVPEPTVRQWRSRKVGTWKKFDGVLCINYHSIPRQTIKRLPNEDALSIEYQAQQDQQELYEQLNAAKLLHWQQYESIYLKDPTLSEERVKQFAQLHSVFKAILDLKEDGYRDLISLYNVFNQLYTGKYSTKNALSNAIRKAGCDGIMSVALDKRVYGNCGGDKRNEDATALSRYWLTILTAHASKFSCSKILEKITAACNENGLKPPSLSWVKLHRRKSVKNIKTFASRYGLIEVKKKMPFASLTDPQKTNQQWQMDGWVLPFWGQKFKRFVLVRLVDAASKLVVGYAFGASEDTALIMEAIRDAVNKTGCLPREILTDNHVFNQTNEAKNLQKLFSRKGAIWTVTENPQYKSIIERYNQYLDAECKDFFGYLGQGIRSKSIEALANSDLIAEYAKQFLSEEEIKGIAISIVDAFNNKKQFNGKSPADLYKEYADEYSINVNVFDRAKLLTAQTEKKISRGQITFRRNGITKHEFQLNASLFRDYNDTVVTVRYEDLKEGIYIFNRKTDEGIAFLPPKCKIHLAKFEQTHADIEALNKHKGRIKGIMTQATKELEEITRKALEVDPEAYAIINRLTTPKNIVSELEQNAHLQQQAEDKGLHVKNIYVPERKINYVPKALQPKEEKRESPFKVSNNKIQLIDPTKGPDED